MKKGNRLLLVALCLAFLAGCGPTSLVSRTPSMLEASSTADSSAVGLGSPSSPTVRHASVPDRLYIADTSYPYPGNVAVYSSGGKSFVKDIKKNVDYPTSLSLSGANLYVGDPLNNAVLVFNVTNGKLSSTLSENVSNPVSLALDSSGTLYVADYSSSSSSAIAVFSNDKFAYLITQGVYEPGMIAVDKGNSLFVPNEDDNSVTVYAKSAKSPKLTITTGVKSPVAVAIDTANNVYVCNSAAQDVTVYQAGSRSPSRTLETGYNPSAVAVSSSDYVYVGGEDAVDIFKPGAMKPTITIPVGVNSPSALVVDGQNHLYVLANGVNVYDATTGKLQTTLKKDLIEPTALAFGN